TEAPQWQVFCQLKTKQLVSVAEEFGNELKRRAELAVDPLEQHFLILANVRLTECRAYLRNVQSHERSKPSAAPVPDSQHGAAQPGASCTTSTTAGAAESWKRCPECGGREREELGFPIFCGVCCKHGRAVQMVADGPLLKPGACERCKLEGIDHDGECRPVEGPKRPPSHQPAEPRAETPQRAPLAPKARTGRAPKGTVLRA